MEGDGEPRKPLLFVSYAHADERRAELLVRTMTAAGLQAWIAVHAVQPGQSFIAEINRALKRSSYLLLLVSAHSVRSDWVQREWMSALAQQEVVILPILLDDTKVPPLLRDIQYFDWRDGDATTLQSLVAFLHAEITPVPIPRRKRGAEFGPPGEVTPRQVRLILQRCMTHADLIAYLLDAGIDGGQVAGDSVHLRVLSLMELLLRYGGLGNVVQWVFIEHPECANQQLNRLREEDVWTPHMP